MTRIDIAGRRLDLELLDVELTAAAIPHGLLGTQAEWLVTYDSEGMLVYEWPDEAVPVVEAHSPPPLVVQYAGTETVSAVLRTTDDVPQEVFRLPTEPKHIYAVEMRMTAVDATGGATKRQKAEMTFKRLASSVVQVGNTVPSTPMQDSAAAGWVIQPGVDGTDFTISVKGTAGRTIDWLLTGDIGRYAPEGLPPPPPPPIP